MDREQPEFELVEPIDWDLAGLEEELRKIRTEELLDEYIELSLEGNTDEEYMRTMKRALTQ